MECRYCKSQNVIKKGQNEKGIQRYYCKDCCSYFLENYEKNRYPDQIKQIALRLYTDGVEISVIARSLEVPYETVRSWIRAEGEKAIKKKLNQEKKEK